MVRRHGLICTGSDVSDSRRDIACHDTKENRHFKVVDAILLRASVDDPSAFETLYRRHAARLRRLVAREVPEGAVLDIVAETFAQVIVSAHRFRGTSDGEAVAWLNAIAHNLARGYHRRARVEDRARRALAIEESVREAIAVAGRCDGVALDLDAALASLSATERQAVELRVIQELDYDEVARRLAIRPDAARMRVSRGLRALALRFAEGTA
jgi:RNA polymerase sigma-70 factor (ECF subfamily)